MLKKLPNQLICKQLLYHDYPPPPLAWWRHLPGSLHHHALPGGPSCLPTGGPDFLIQRWGSLRSAKRCRRCILGLLYSANLKLESPNLTQCSVYSVQCTLYTGGGAGYMSNSGTPASNRQNTASPKLNDNTSMLISQYLISAFIETLLLVLNKGSWTKNNTVRERRKKEKMSSL